VRAAVEGFFRPQVALGHHTRPDNGHYDVGEAQQSCGVKQGKQRALVTRGGHLALAPSS